MTSPSCPVSTSPPFPAIEAASTNNTSPPTPVTARPVATPGNSRTRRRLVKELRSPERFTHGRHIDDNWLGLMAGGHPRGSLAKHGAQFAFQLTDSSFTSVISHDQAQHVVVRRHIVHTQAVSFHLARPQVPAGDRDLFVGRVAVEPDDFHPVEERCGNRIRHVGRCDEENV